MRYMLVIYSTEMDHSEEERARLRAAHFPVMDEMSRQGILRGAEPLQPAHTATTVRYQAGKPLILDGPFAETKEQLAGYYILDCANLDEAIQWAAKIPTGCLGEEGCIEIRPVAKMPLRESGTPR